MNKFPLRLNAGLPTLAEEMTMVRASLMRLLELNVTTVYPGHGKPFSMDIIREALRKHLPDVEAEKSEEGDTRA